MVIIKTNQTSSIKNRPIQIINVEESIRHKIYSVFIINTYTFEEIEQAFRETQITVCVVRKGG